MSSDCPPLEYERAQCPVCQAETVEQAAARCQQQSDETGERWCKGGMEDDGTHLIRPTLASLSAINAWCDREAEREGWA